MRLIFIFLLFCNGFGLTAQTHAKLFEKHDQYREPTITHRRFKHKDIEPLVLRLKADPQFRVKKLGSSVEGRSIYLVSVGTGKTDVLLWSQMHGDEPTATMALMDIFNFFSQKDGFEPLKKLLKTELTLHFVPMLNPDGAEKYQRRNAMGVDLNRDALRLQNPESRILKMVRDSLEAAWGFNLHDQSKYYAAGQKAQTASISFLAPAYNYGKEVNEVRGNAMRLIGVMDQVLQQYIPGKTARYADDFEPRAFGDNITKWGTSTILIESGGLPNDPEKQFLRKLHFVILLASFEAIADKSVHKTGMNIYQKLPFNKFGAFNDLTLRNARVERNGQTFILDIAFRINETEAGPQGGFYQKASIADIGDLSTSYSYEELDASGFEISYGKLFPETIENVAKLKKMDLAGLLADGVLFFRLKDFPANTGGIQFPFVLLETNESYSDQIGMGANPALLLSKNGKVEKVVVNGALFDLKQDQKKIQLLINGL